MTSVDPVDARTTRDHAELGFAALLGVAGAAVLVDAFTLHAPYSEADPVGPRTVPFIVAGLLLVCAAVLAVDVVRGGHGEAEEGEDVDLTGPMDWRTVLTLVAVLVADIALVDRLGWVVSGTLLFWGCVWALGGRSYLRDGVISFLLALGTFYGFYVGLGIYLPAGVLDGIL